VGQEVYNAIIIGTLGLHVETCFEIEIAIWNCDKFDMGTSTLWWFHFMYFEVFTI
jgi:hypothetical protein